MRKTIAISLLLTLMACSGEKTANPETSSGSPAREKIATNSTPGNVTDERVLDQQSAAKNWLVNGHDFTGQHHSPLKQINVENINDLGLAWWLDIPSPMGFPMETIVVDGVAYVTGTLNRVYAIDLATAKTLWMYDPQIFKDEFMSSWVARVNRGVAVWEGKVYIGTANCELIALEAATGAEIWRAPVCDRINNKTEKKIGTQTGYITGAPRVGDGKVFMGYGMGELGAKGSLAAFDAETGEELWRFWTLPYEGDESKGAQIAAKTWSTGVAPAGGGTVWDAIRYDPVTGYVIFGTSSPSPTNAILRDPEELDNLFGSSIIAVDANTGEYIWHYQAVPADAWDFDSTMPKIIADIDRDGEKRRVVFEIGKNGFFYVLDAYTGELLAADPVVYTSWASHIDMKTGRPVEVPGSRFYERKDPIYLTPTDAHQWQPMSYNPETGLIYMPISEQPADYSDGGIYGFVAEGYGKSGVYKGSGKLIAWDPIEDREAWSVDLPRPYNGGTMSTAGNLVFQGTAEGDLQARDAKTGELLWSYKTGSAIQANPVSYELDGEQYILMPVGQGSGIAMNFWDRATGPEARGPSRLLAFKIGGKAALPPGRTTPDEVPEPPALTASAEQIENGRLLYSVAGYGCEGCHGYAAVGRGERNLSDGAVPDLRYIPKDVHATEWHAIVMSGLRLEKGMLGFSQFGMTLEESEAIQAYVISEAWKAHEAQQGEASPN